MQNMIQSQDLFDKFLEEAEHNPDFGFSSYVLKRGKKYERYNNVDGQFYFDSSLEKATHFREYEAKERLERHCEDVEIEVVGDPHTRASNAFWRSQHPYRVVQIRMEGQDKENPENNQFFGITPSGRLIELHTKIIEQGMTEVFWCATQEVPWRLFGFVSEFL